MRHETPNEEHRVSSLKSRVSCLNYRPKSHPVHPSLPNLHHMTIPTEVLRDRAMDKYLKARLFFEKQIE